MPKAIKPFVPLRGDEPHDARVEAFNTLGQTVDALAGRVDAGFQSAVRERKKVARELAEHVKKTAAYQSEMRGGMTEIHDKFVTIEGQMRALSDQVVRQGEALEGRIDRFADLLAGVALRVGAGKTGEIKPLTAWKIAGVIATVIALWTAVLKLLPVIPALNKALLGQ